MGEPPHSIRQGESDSTPTVPAVAGEVAPRRPRSASRPPPPASIIVIGCRILGAIALIVALSVGQWAQVTFPNDEPASGGPESRTVFGLTEASIHRAKGASMHAMGSSSYSSATADERGDAEGTSKTFGMAIGALALAAALLTAGSFGELFGKPRLSALATFGLLASVATSLLGWVFQSVGIVSWRAAQVASEAGGASVTKTTGGFSFYTSILALLILAIGWTRSRVVAMDAARRASRPPPPKRRRRA